MFCCRFFVWVYFMPYELYYCFSLPLCHKTQQCRSQHKDKNSTHTQKTYNKTFIKESRMVYNRHNSISDPKPRPEQWARHYKNPSDRRLRSCDLDMRRRTFQCQRLKAGLVFCLWDDGFIEGLVAKEFRCGGLLGLRNVLGWWREYRCGSCGLISPCWIQVLGVGCIWGKRQMTTVPWALLYRLAYFPLTWPWQRRIHLSGFRCPWVWNPICLRRCLRCYFGRRREGHLDWTWGAFRRSCECRWMNLWRYRDMTECAEWQTQGIGQGSWGGNCCCLGGSWSSFCHFSDPQRPRWLAWSLWGWDHGGIIHRFPRKNGCCGCSRV